MRRLRKLDLEKMRLFLVTHKGIVSLVGVLVVLVTIFLFSRHQDQKTITYQQSTNTDFSTGKILGGGSDIYQLKEKALTEKFEELEHKLEVMTEELEKQKAEGLPEDREETEEIAKNEAPVFVSHPPFGNAPKAPNSGGNAEIIQVNAPYSLTPSMPVPAPVNAGPDVISFPAKAKAESSVMSVKVPSGSFVKAKLLTGVEAPEGKALPVLLQADYAFVGPNKSKIDLSGCFMIAKSTGNLSIERVEMQASKISCVAKNGRMFEREINGFIADNKDNSFAVMGDVNSKQDRVAAMAFLASVVQGVTNAIGQAQTKTETNSVGGSTLSISGDQQKFIAASGASNAASMVAQWYLGHAQNLLPTINVGSGQDVWIIMQDSVDLPNWYFKKHESRAGEFSFLSNLTE